EQAIIHNPYHVPGTGILSLGGMSFDPLKEKSNLWKNYKPSQFTIPEYVVTKDKDTYYFTMITKVHREDQVGEISGELQAMERKLFQKERTSSPESSTIIDREEIDTAKWISNVNQAIDEIKNERAKKIVIA